MASCRRDDGDATNTAAICVAHAVGALLRADRDFTLFPELPTRNPLPQAPA